MKKQFLPRVFQFLRNNVLRTAAFVILFLSIAPLSGSAGDTSNVTFFSSEISYLGSYNQNDLLFNVKFSDQQEQSYYFTIKDQDGLILFEQFFRGKSFSKKFLIQMENLENANLYFSFTSQKSATTETFSVENKTGKAWVAMRL